MPISVESFRKINYLYEMPDEESNSVRRDYLYKFTVDDQTPGWVRIATLTYFDAPERNHSAAFISDGNGSLDVHNLVSPLAFIKSADAVELIKNMVTRYNTHEFVGNVISDLSKL